MPFSVQIGLLFAVATAFASIVGFFYKQRGAVQSPAITLRAPWSSTVGLFKSRWWLLGIAIALGSWFLHVAALALAPISIVQATIAGGLVLLTVIADRLFGFNVSKREWIGVAITAAGLSFLAATMGSTGHEAHANYDTATLIAYGGAALLLGSVAAVVAGRWSRPGIVLAVSAGLLWGASDVSIKALSANVGDGVIDAALQPLSLVVLIASLVGLLVSARSLQIGEAVAVIAVTSATANVVTIASGSIVFMEPMPDNPIAFAVRILAFAMVVIAAALTPAPVRAIETIEGLEV
ncbi:MAG: hypothetical protein NTV40_00080 [Solirubrobacterales bacterium]|nr:hypothetical protein [Solirubrobacterales bacterium]